MLLQATVERMYIAVLTRLCVFLSLSQAKTKTIFLPLWIVLCKNKTDESGERVGGRKRETQRN